MSDRSGQKGRGAGVPADFIPPTGESALDPVVYGEEVAAINERRRRFGQPPVTAAAGTPPSARHGLAGLAFSGGGIRSATVNIGLLQGFGKFAAIERFDYLSTVSGGGFAGGCLSTTLKTAPIPEGEFIRISGLPEGARIEGGSLDGDGEWVISLTQMRGSGGRLVALVPAVSSDHLVTASLETKDERLRVSVSMLAQEQVRWSKHCVDGEAWGLVIKRAAACKVELLVAEEQFPLAFRRPHHRPESIAMQHLREYADYLRPHQALAGLRIPALFVVGFVTNCFVLLPWLLWFAVGTYVVWSSELQHALCTNDSRVVLRPNDFDENGHYQLDLARFLIRPETCLARRDGQPSASDLSTAAWVNLLNVPSNAHVDPSEDGGPAACALQERYSNRSQLMLKCPDELKDPSIRIGMAAFDDPFRDVLEITVRAWWSPRPPSVFDTPGRGRQLDADDVAFVTDPISALKGSAYWPVLFSVWILVFGMIQYPLSRTPRSWKTRDNVTRVVFGLGIVALGVITAISMQPLATYYLVSALGAPKAGGFAGGMGGLALAFSALIAILGALLARSSAVQALGRTLLMYLAALAGFLMLWLVASYFTLWLLDCNHIPGIAILRDSAAGAWVQKAFDALDKVLPFIQLSSWSECSLDDPSTELALLFLILGLLLWRTIKVRFNVNKTSFHMFYRDRLSRAFCFNPWGSRIEHEDPVPVADLATERGPFHVLNTTLNLPRAKAGSLRGRGCDFFVVTPRRVGGQMTGYVGTADYADAEPNFDLSSVMAISGAAAAPTMGLYTNRALVFLMALLNVRLGFWAHNPRLHERPPVTKKSVGAWYLLREMFGALDDQSRFVNLSDGGHLENLGVYELIRRRCRIIFCSDCQADEQMMFDGLADLIRLVRIDMGVEIDIDVDQMARHDDGLSRCHFACGRIDYPGDEPGEIQHGVLIYLKASLTGDEGLYIDNYRSDHPSFPNETTADQFFDEPQFEAYRSLGQHIATTLLESAVAQAWLQQDDVDVAAILRAAEGGDREVRSG